MENRFVEVDPGQTKWIIMTEFKFQGFLMKLIGAIMPGSFKKQTMTFMVRFKEFAESA